MKDIPCPLCGGDGRAPVCSRTRHGQEFFCVRCTGCGFHFVSPEPDAAELLAFYDDEYSAGHTDTWHGFEDDLNRQVISALRARRVASLLDLGAGQGRFVRMARDAGLAAEGVEPSAANGSQALERYGVRLQRATVQQFLESRSDRQECVTMLNVLEHLPDPVAVLRGIAGILRPGGVVLLVVPNVDFTLTLGRLRRAAGFRDVYMLDSPRFTQQGFDPPVHLSSFNAAHLGTAVRKAGLEVETMTQAAVIRSASPVFQTAKRAVALAGQGLELISGGRVVWGYSLLCVARHRGSP